jgi:hypothetical protein
VEEWLNAICKEEELTPDSVVAFIPNNYSSYEIVKKMEGMNAVRKRSKRTGLCIRKLNTCEA